MSSKLKFFCIISISTVFFGCRPTQTLIKNFNSGAYSLDYMYDSRISHRFTADSVFLKDVVLQDSAIRPNNRIEELSYTFVPFILIYATDAKYNCVAGRDLFQEDLKDFFKTKIEKEVERFGQFVLTNRKESEFSLEISIDTVQVSSEFTYNSVFVPPGAYSEHQNSGPGNSIVKVTYKIYKHDRLVYAKQVVGDYPIFQNQFPIANRDRFQKEFAISFVEATSLNFRGIITMIVDDINKYFAISN